MDWLQFVTLLVQGLIVAIVLFLLVLYAVQRLQKEKFAAEVVRQLTPDQLEALYDKAAQRAVKWYTVVYGALGKIGEDKINVIIDYAVDFLTAQNIKTTNVELIRKLVHELLSESGGRQ